MPARIQLRRDTAANWTATNPTLTQGEPGIETDTGKLKLGDGSTAWNSLAYQAAANIVDGTIVNADINASAAIADTKLDTISTTDKVSLSALNIDGGTDIGAALADVDLFIVDDGGAGTNRKAAATRITDYAFGKVSGDLTISSAGVATIGSGVIVDVDINASAAIAFSKLATLSSANILLGNGSNVATATAISGDVSITNTGVTTVVSGSTTTAGKLQLTDSTSSTSTTTAATPNSVKSAYDLAAAAQPKVRAVAAGATTGTLTPNGATTDVFEAEGLTGAITLAAPSGTPADGQRLLIRIKDNGTARGITWTTSAGAYRAVGITLPTTTVISKVTYVGCIYNGTDSFWDAIATVTQA